MTSYKANNTLIRFSLQIIKTLGRSSLEQKHLRQPETGSHQKAANTPCPSPSSNVQWLFFSWLTSAADLVYMTESYKNLGPDPAEN